MNGLVWGHGDEHIICKYCERNVATLGAGKLITPKIWCLGCQPRRSSIHSKMKEDKPIDQFICTFRSLRLKLAHTSNHLTEEDVCIRLLAALPASYLSFVTSQNAVLRLVKQVSAVPGKSESEIPGLAINELVGALMQEEVSKQTNKSGTKNQALMAAKNPQKGFRKSGNKGTGPCSSKP